MTMTITKQALREIIADTLREHRADAPGDCADSIIEVLRSFAPKAFIDQRIDTDSDSKYTAVAEEMIRAAAFNIDQWEIKAFKPTWSDEEIQQVDDLIGQASVTVTF